MKLISWPTILLILRANYKNSCKISPSSETKHSKCFQPKMRNLINLRADLPRVNRAVRQMKFKFLLTKSNLLESPVSPTLVANKIWILITWKMCSSNTSNTWQMEMKKRLSLLKKFYSQFCRPMIMTLNWLKKQDKRIKVAFYGATLVMVNFPQLLRDLCS